MIIVNELSKVMLHDLLEEANGFLITMTGNLSDEKLSLDDSQIRYGLSLVLMESMNRINKAITLLND